MTMIRQSVLVLARFLISLVFLAGAVSKVLHWHDTEKLLLKTLSEWQGYVGFSDLLHEIFSFIIPLTPLVLLIGTIFELIGGLSVLLGVKEKFGALLLIVFLLPTTLIMHQFWFAEGSQRELQMVHFLKNIAILGALILIALHGTTQKKHKSPIIKLK